MAQDLVSVQKLEDVLTLVTEGTLTKKAAAAVGIPLSTLYRHLRSDPQTWEIYRRAREIGASALADESVEIADSEPDARRARVRAQVRQWLASKLDPKTFGDKLDLTITENVDLSAARQRGRERAAERLRPVCDQSNIVDAEIVSKSIASGAKPTDTESVTDVPDLDIFK